MNNKVRIVIAVIAFALLTSCLVVVDPSAMVNSPNNMEYYNAFMFCVTGIIVLIGFGVAISLMIVAPRLKNIMTPEEKAKVSKDIFDQKQKEAENHPFTL